MIKKFSLIISVLLIISLLLCGCGKTSAENYKINESDTISIGAILPMSGEYSNLGLRISEGLEYAVSLASGVQIDKEYKTQLVIEDSNSFNEEMVKEMTDSKVCAVICAGETKEKTDEIISAFSDTGIPLVFINANSDSILSANNVFALSAPYNFQASAATSHLIGEGYNSGAIILDANDKFSSAFAETFKNTFESNGSGEVQVYYSEGDGNSLSVDDISAASYDFIFIATEANTALDVYNKLKESDVNSHMIFSEIFDKGVLSDTAYDGVSFISRFEEDDGNYIGTDFMNTYSQNSDISISEITAATAYGYDAYMTVYEALRNFNPNGQTPIFGDSTVNKTETVSEIKLSDVLDKLNEVEHYGVTDTIKFNEKGTVDVSYIYIDTVEGGKPVMYNRYDYNNEQN